MGAKMENKNKTRRLIFIILLIILVATIVVGLYFWQMDRLTKARLEATNPAVFIHEPVQGTAAQTGRWIVVNSSATGLRLMKSIEIWINGELIEIQESGLPGGVGVIYGTFPLLVQEGAQTVVVRAIDAEGYIGQSDPLSITGIAATDDQQPYLLVPFNHERPLENIAMEYQIPLDELMEHNAGIPLEPEGLVQVPVKPEEENTPITPDQIPPDLLVQNGYVSGKICYPSQYIPEMTAYFENISTGQYLSLPIALNQNTYGIFLPPGKYKAYAWLPDFSLGGSYSKAVPCGLTTNCTDHTLIEFQVNSGTNINGVDICDWYDIPSVPTTPGAPSSPAQPLGPQITSDIPMLTPKKVFPANNNASLPFGIAVPLRPPGVPKNFAARNDQCKIRIGWDKPQPAADGYSVWLTGQTGIKLLAADLKTDEDTAQQAWYEFKSPMSGLISVWVEAYNFIGSTASTVKTLQLPSNCSSSPNEDLELQTLELNVGGGFEDVYLYLSVEGIPEERLPDDDSSFLSVQEGSANLASGAMQYTLPKPDDGSLSISGECWGWAGGTPTKLSSFDISIPESDWTGFNTDVGNENCSFALNLKKKEDDINNYQTMAGKGSPVAPPFNVRYLQNKFYEDSNDPSEEWSWFWEREIRWQWPHDIKEINGFSIYHNGKLLKTVPSNVRSATVILPSWCGDKVDWTVSANPTKGAPAISQPASESLPICGKYAEVVFEKLDIHRSCDSCCCSDHANDTIETYFYLIVNGLTKPVGTKNYYIPLNKGSYWFSQLVNIPGDIGKDRFVVRIPKEPFTIQVFPKFYDYDPGSGDDLWGYHQHVYNFSTFNDGIAKFGNPQGTYFPFGKLEGSWLNDDDVTSNLSFRIWIYQGNKTP